VNATTPIEPGVRLGPAGLLRATLEWPPLRRVLRALRHTPDRALHRRRRRRALRRLRGRELPASVLFLCQGNVCRSPYAAAAFARALPAAARARVRVESAGFIGPDRPPPSRAIHAAAARRIDLTEHRSSLLSRERVDAAALVVVMTTEQERAIVRGCHRDRVDVLVLGDLDPEPIDTRAVADPWGRATDAYVRSYDRIDRCVRELARALAGQP
jgi:protein-tyrosine-phosphatase